MALISPGVQVTVSDESQYTPTAAGSVAYVLLATAQDKTNPSGALAPYTTAANANKLFNITSQRELVANFGNIEFRTDSADNPLNGDERNEYGLLAAYSALGVSNTIYVQRANVDLGALTGTTTRPLATPSNGNLWLDTTSSIWGVYEWDFGTQTFTLKNTTVITDSSFIAGDSFTPNVSVGAIGDYAVNAVSPYNPVFYKNYNNAWQLVGNTGWQLSIPAITGTVTSPVIGSTSVISINGTNVTLGAGSNVSTVATAINAQAITGILARVANNQLVISASDAATSAAANVQNASGTALTTLGITAGKYPAAATSIAPYNNIPEWQGNVFVSRPTGSVWQKASVLGTGEKMVVKQYNSTSTTWNSITVNNYANVFAATFALDPTGGGANIPSGSVFNQYDAYGNGDLANYLWYRKNTGATVVTGSTTSPSAAGVGASFTLTTRPNATVSTTTTYTVTVTTGTVAGFITAVAAANIPDVTAAQATTGAITLTHAKGGDMLLVDGAQTPLANVGINTSGSHFFLYKVVSVCTFQS